MSNQDIAEFENNGSPDGTETAPDPQVPPAPDPAAAAGGEPAPPGVRQALEELQFRADGYLNDLLRARAEADNLRKRAQRDVENAHKYGQERFITEMLPVKDSMELGISAAQTATDVAVLKEGMELTLKMFGSAFEKLGVAEVNPAGEKFNPELHQAITMQESDADPHTVLTVVQKGYRLNDRLIRPALVIVARPRDG